MDNPFGSTLITYPTKITVPASNHPFIPSIIYLKQPPLASFSCHTPTTPFTKSKSCKRTAKDKPLPSTISRSITVPAETKSSRGPIKLSWLLYLQTWTIPDVTRAETAVPWMNHGWNVLIHYNVPRQMNSLHHTRQWAAPKHQPVSPSSANHLIDSEDTAMPANHSVILRRARRARQHVYPKTCSFSHSPPHH